MVRQNTENYVASMSHLSLNLGGIGTPGARSKIADGDENSSDSGEEERLHICCLCPFKLQVFGAQEGQQGHLVKHHTGG